MPRPYWRQPQVLHGYVDPTKVEPTGDDAYVLTIGEDSELGQLWGLAVGDEVSFHRQFELSDPPPKLMCFDCRMRTPETLPAGEVLVSNATVDFVATGLVIAGDGINGIKLTGGETPFTSAHVGRIARISGAAAAANNGDFPITAVPKDQASVTYGNVAMIANPDISAAAADTGVTIELLGLWWHVRIFVNGALRCELAEPMHQASPDGVWRTDMAINTSKMYGGQSVNLDVVVSLEATALS